MTTDSYDNPPRPNRRDEQRREADAADPPQTPRPLPVQLVRCRGCRRYVAAERAVSLGWWVEPGAEMGHGAVAGWCPECRKAATM